MLLHVVFQYAAGVIDACRAVANEQGSFTTPSFVSFTDEERLIGEAAKNQAAMNPANTIFDIKYVGRSKPEGRSQLMLPQADSLGVSLGEDSMTRP